MEAMKLDQSNPGIAFVPTKHTKTYAYIDPLKADLSEKVVVISGASKGVGKAMAISYAKAGASKIAMLARSDLSCVAEEVKQAVASAGRPKPQILTIKCDITQVGDCDEAARTVGKEFGRLDVLINNAGYLETWRKIHESDPEDWWRSWEVNVKGVYLMCRAFLPLLLEGGDKTIVTMTSAGGIVRTPGASAYQSTKTAEIRLNDYLTVEYGDQGLLAYAVHPGGIKTELASGMPDEVQRAVLTDEPDLPGDTIVWLTQEKREWLADRYVSCQWDMEEFLAKRKEIEDNNLLRLRLRL